jgi:CcmD family protein
MENWHFLVAAYTIGWLGVAVYVFLNMRKQERVEKRIAQIETRLSDRG